QEGKIAAQGVLYRLGKDDFIYTGRTAYRAHYMLQSAGWNAESVIETPDHFLFSVQGPRSLGILERSFGMDFGNVRFNRFVNISFEGASMRVLRTGVSGTLGYELHGPCTHGNLVWAKVVEAGKEFGIKQLGKRAQVTSHVEAGIAT